MSASEITLIGNLTADPELTFTTGGAAKAAFGLAVNYFWTDQSGEKQEKASYFNIVAWRQLAEDTANALVKGKRVVVKGRLEQRSYQDKDGNNRSVVEVIAEDIAISVKNIESVEWKARPANAEAGAQTTRKAQPKQKVAVSDEEPF
jgi:single-strand DNA-binding protein